MLFGLRTSSGPVFGVFGLCTALALSACGGSAHAPDPTALPTTESSATRTTIPRARSLREALQVPLASTTPTPLPISAATSAYPAIDPYASHFATASACLTALASPAGTASSTVQPLSSARPFLGPLRTVLDETFVDNRRGWPDNRQATAWLVSYGYYLYARQPGHFVAIGAPLAESLTDVVVTARYRKVGGMPGGGYGVIVRDQGPGPRDGLNQGGRYYVLEVGDRGEVGIWRREQDRWIDLVPWTPSGAVRGCGLANEVIVQAVGARLTLLVNGLEVASVVDDLLAEGAVGVFVGGDLNEVMLDRLVVQVPE